MNVPSPITGNVWKIEVQPGATVHSGDCLIILESMKMEIRIEAPSGGHVKEIKVKEGQAVNEGDIVAEIE